MSHFLEKNMFIDAFTLNAFTWNDEGGNPAGVVFDADELTEDQMKQIARRIGFSETAFVMNSSVANFKVRFFTPTEEVDLCGHATVATFCLMHHMERISAGTYTQETLAGVLKVTVSEDGTVLMDQALPQFYAIVENEEDRSALALSLGLETSALSGNLPIQVVSTGLKDLMVPVKDLSTLRAIAPNFDAIRSISQKYDVTGYHVFTLETLHGSTAHCRNFAPLFGIPEESATGTSNGALGSYLLTHHAVTPNQAAKMTMEQGFTMKQPSMIHVALTLDEASAEISSVQVGGHSSNMAMKELKI